MDTPVPTESGRGMTERSGVQTLFAYDPKTAGSDYRPFDLPWGFVVQNTGLLSVIFIEY